MMPMMFALLDIVSLIYNISFGTPNSISSRLDAELLSQFLHSLVFPFFQHYWNPNYQLNITFIIYFYPYI